MRAVGPRIGRGALAAAVLSVPTVVIGVLVSRNADPIIRLDHHLVSAATDYTRGHPGFTSALLAWQQAFHPRMVYPAAIPVAVWTWSRGLKARTVWGVVTMLVGWNLGLQAKLLVERARPVIEDPVSHAPGFSFPSGHAYNIAMVTTTCLVMAWPLLRRRTRPARAAVIGAAAVTVVLTALDRVFLGVHFPSDVTAGILLAPALSAASFIGYSHTPRHAVLAARDQIAQETS